MEFVKSADVVVIGGGIVGTAIYVNFPNLIYNAFW